MTAGDIYTVAGNGTEGFSGNGGPAIKAELYRPGGVRVDKAGNLVIADTYNNRVRVVAASTGTFYGRPMTAGDIYTVAGNETRATGNGGPAVKAAIRFPAGSAFDHSGNLVIAGGYGDNRIPVVAGGHRHVLRPQAMTAGRHLHRGRRREPAAWGMASQPPPPSWPTRARWRWTVGREPADQRHDQRPGDPGGRGGHRHVLRPRP